MSTRTASALPFSKAAACAILSTITAARVSPLAELVQRYPIRSDNVIAHIRKATQGQVSLENTHPFVRELWGRYWVFAHNGNLKDFPAAPACRLQAPWARLTASWLFAG